MIENAMPFPVLIDTGSTNTTSNPPYQQGTARYVLDSTGMFKSTDGGLTWVLKDSAGTPAVIGPNCIHGTKIYTVARYFDPIGMDVVNLVSIFDTSVDTWIQSALSPPDSVVVNVSNLFYRASDNMLIETQFFSSGHGSPNVCQYQIIAPDASTISGWTTLGNDPTIDWSCNGILPGNGRVHFLLGSGFSFGAGTRNLCQQTLPDGGSLQTTQTIDTINDGGSTEELFFQGAGDGTTIIVAWVPTSLASNIKTFKGTSASPNITFSTQTITYPNTMDAFTMVRNGSSYLFVATDDGVTTTLALATDSGGGYGSYSTLGSCPVGTLTPQYMTSGPLTTNPWGVVLSGSTYYWETFSPPPPGGPGKVLLNQNQAMPALLPDVGLHCQRVPNPHCSGGRILLTSKIMYYPPTRGNVASGFARKPNA